MYPYGLTINALPEVASITFNPAGTICAGSSVQLNAIASHYSGVVWNYSGLGSWQNINTLTPTYTSSLSDTLNGVLLNLALHGNGACDFDFTPPGGIVQINVTPPPHAYVQNGAPVQYCTTAGALSISANAQVYGGIGFWSAPSSIGTFNDPNDPTPIFNPNPTTPTGPVTIYYIAQGIGACSSERDTAEYYLYAFEGPTANILPTALYNCGTDTVLISVITNSIGSVGTWSGASPLQFNTNSSTTTVFTPYAGDVGQQLTLTWTTQDPNGPCNAIAESVSLNVNVPATADAGGPYTTCGTVPVNIAATANGSGSWSGGTGTFGNPNSASTTYTPASSEVGYTVQLTWTTTDPDVNGPCGPVQSPATLTVVTPPNAGSDGTYAACSNDEPFELFIHLGGSPQAGGSWTFDNNSVNGTFTPGTSPEGEYTYTVLPPSGCPNVATATVTVTETTAAVAGEYNIVNLCDSGVSVNLITLLGSNITPGGTWNSTLLTGSNGTFNPQADSSGTYTYTVQPNGPCPADTASVTVTIVSAADAGNDTTLYFCSIGEAVLLNSLSGNWTSGYWVDPQYGDTLGDNLEYDPSTMDYNSLMFVATTQSPCPSDEAIVFIIENPAPATPEINSVDLVMNSDTVCRGQYPSLITPAITGASYTWSCTAWEPDTVDGTNLNTIAPQWSSEPGQYTITLTVVDPAGCSNTGERTVTLLPDSASCPKGIFYFEPHGLGVLDDQARWFEWGTVNTSQSTFVPDPTVQGYQSQTMFDPDQLAAYAGGLPTNPFYAVRTSRYPDGHCSSFTTQWVTQELLDRACLLDNGGFGPDLGYRVYPNPVTAGELTVEALGQPSVLPVEATLYDLGGRLMYTEQLPAGARATLRTDLGALGQGVYVLRLRNAQLENTFKVIIQ